MTIPVAHDFTCPWCWIGFFQAKRLEKEFGANIDWIAYELWPEELDWPQPAPPVEKDPRRPRTPTRLDLAYAAEEMERPTVERPKQMRSHNAHEAVEFAKSEGVADQMVERLYRAYWEEGKKINDPGVLAELAKGIVKDFPDFLKAIDERRFKSAIIGFDQPAYESGIFNVPTFTIGGVKYAEEPYAVLRKAAKEAK